MSSLSLIIPTCGEPALLQRLFHSLIEQDINKRIEILLSLTGDPEVLQAHLPKLPNHFDVRIVKSPEKNISMARNRALQIAQGQTIVFIDDDCILPDPSVLSRIQQFTAENPLSAGGGLYLNNIENSYFWDRSYNLLCNLWARIHQQNSPLFLGGCGFISRELITTKGLQFAPSQARSGEEYSFWKPLSSVDTAIVSDEQFSFVHAPQMGIRTFFKKAWVQGPSAYTNDHSHISLINGLHAIAHFPLLDIIKYSLPVILFLFCGRISGFYEFASRRMRQKTKINNRAYPKSKRNAYQPSKP